MVAQHIIEEDIAHILSAALPWQQFHGKTILITGASGALAHYMTASLLRLNDRLDKASRCRVIALSRNAARMQEVFAPYGKRDDLTLLVQDVCAPIALSQPVHFIIHAASQASPKYYGSDPVGTIDANVLGTHQLLSLAVWKQTEAFLFFSTSEVYGQSQGGSGGIRETDYGVVDPTALRACYAESKRLGETMCVAWQHQHGVPVKIVRPFHVYGPGFRLDDGRVFTDFVANAVAGKDITLTSDGSAVRSFCYIADAVQAFFTILLQGRAAQAYNVGNPGAAISMKELAESLAGMVPRKRLKVITASPQKGYIPSSVNRTVPDIASISALGWKPQTLPEQGFMRMISFYEAGA